jgi:carboxyl-terminal processing protease
MRMHVDVGGPRALAALLVALVLLGRLPAAWAEGGSPPPKTAPPVYAPYVRDPSALEFRPDARLFDEVYRQIKARHVEEDPDSRLYAGVLGEVRALLGEAKVATDGLDDLPRDATLPEAIVARYRERVDPRVLWYAMVRGLFAGTGDRYSVLMTPKEFRGLLQALEDQTFAGVGIFVELDSDHQNQLTVIEPVEGSPASRAGIMPGDRIVAVDGKSTAGITLDGASVLLRGKVGSRVVLTVERGARRLEVPIERAAIEVPSVSHKMLPGAIAYIRLRVYGDKTASEFSEALAACEKAGAQGLIVDVRNNSGGYLVAAESICSHFLRPGDVVTYITDRSGKRRDYPSEPIRRSTLPMVLLVNNYSASASEITAGCLKDYGVATLVGVKTFGKGSVQQVFKLSDGAAFKLTIAYFFTPHGGRINKIGVEPDVRVEMEPRLVGHDLKKDVQMARALEILGSKVSTHP